ncbi:MAG: hypothetical protein IJB11_04555 [Oscillospiraceae bacterium]|nr:hypothetical protein [Oscillospiraceae bacterium]
MAGQYQFGKQKELDELTDRILNREKFSYDLNGDAFYNQYKDKFTQQGKLAMMDTMGQAAALTGGYGSSYAQRVGQQTYQGYLQGLNDKVPELYQLALDNYDRQGDALTQQYGLLADLDAKDYSRHRDAVADQQYQQQMAYQKERDAVADAQWNKQFNASKTGGGATDNGDTKYTDFGYEEQQKWDEEFQEAKSLADVERIADRMEQAGIDPIIVANWYEVYAKKFGYEQPKLKETPSWMSLNKTSGGISNSILNAIKRQGG